MSLNLIKKTVKFTTRHLDLHPLHLDSPGSGGLVNDLLHQVTDHFSLGEDLGQSLDSYNERKNYDNLSHLGSEDIPQAGGH